MGECRPPSVAATPAQIYFQYRDTQRQVLDNFEGAHSASSWQTSTIGDAVTQTGLPSNPVETQLFPQDNQSPHDTGGLRFVWDNLGDKLEVAIPAGSRNVTAFNAISIRAGQVVGSASNPAAAQNVRLTLRDGGGNARAIRVSAFGVAGVGPAVPIPADADFASNKKSAMATIRIPLSAYTTVCAGAVRVDLTNVTSVALELNDMNTGEIAADEIEFSR